MMRSLAVISAAAVLRLVIGRVAADGPFQNLNCKTAKVQMVLNCCADRDFKLSDKRLNRVYS
jgi:uncharacterized protein YecT (DUF1311 family)